MKETEMRKVALGAVRATLRGQGRSVNVSVDTAWAILDEIAAQDPALVASQWYLRHGESKGHLFARDWRVSSNN